jgi:ATP-dependent exoDNAse (exonuclease V) alpha subunit
MSNACGSRQREFRVSDRLVVTENNYRLHVFNGDTETLMRAQPEKHVVVLQTRRDEAMFVKKELTALTLGYAINVHRAQGGEFPSVCTVVTGAKNRKELAEAIAAITAGPMSAAMMDGIATLQRTVLARQ